MTEEADRINEPATSPVESAEADEAGRPSRDGIALCLSGGGYRAAAFHLGALRRLHETGVLARVLQISSVSGGSILAAHLAQCMSETGTTTLRFADWEHQVAAPFRDRILTRDIRTVPFLKQWLLPWNWFRAGPAVRALERQYLRHLTRLSLAELPGQVRFTFCATDLHYGVNWVFERERIGDYRAGHFRTLSEQHVARAVAASSCFPPIFLPMKFRLPRRQTRGRPGSVHLSDGGVYDNLGLQPVWQGRSVVLVSDGGAPFDFKAGTTPLHRLKRYTAIATNQVASIRWQWLMARLRSGEIEGTSWRIGNTTRAYRGAPLRGYSRHLARDFIGEMRTDMDGFSVDEISILENHGYLLAAAAVETHLPGHLDPGRLAPTVPHPALTDEARVRGALAQSHRRRPIRSLIRLVTRPHEPFAPRLPR